MSSRGAASILRAGAFAAVLAASALSAPALAVPPASISLPSGLDAVTAAPGRALYAKRIDGAPILIVREGPGHNAPSELLWPAGAAARPVLQAAGAAPGPLLAARGRILFVPRHPVDGHAALASVGIAGGPVSAVGAPGAGGPRTPLAFDGTTAAFASFSCQGTAQVTLVDVGARPAAGADDGCPVRLARDGIRFGRRGRATIGVRCPNTCNTVLRLVLRRAGTVAVARLQLPASARMRDVSLRLTHRGRVARRGHRRLAVVPVSTGVRTP